ncbi:hypothetical protein DKX38_024402 [Salix brachista]|uniref:Protein kinase domain-containing protein n=1 Tax=Salix brachista TaxID=2182728 RepID=A0A5N5JRY0_9ROSI|nr:hypothetical protein DKX38_024402 [Salix brachista]
MKRITLANAYGAAFPVQMGIERQMLSRFQRPPGPIPSSMLGLEALTGSLEDFGFEDYLNGIYFYLLTTKMLFSICRALAYIHNSIGVCHRDIKPQNLLVKGELNISYICSRYYRAPELIFGATQYTSAIDIWSAGCVLAELLLGQVDTSLSG